MIKNKICQSIDYQYFKILKPRKPLSLLTFLKHVLKKIFIEIIIKNIIFFVQFLSQMLNKIDKKKTFVKPSNNSTIFEVLLTNIFNKVKKGTVKFFNESKGFGFVTEDDSNTEYFVHVSGLIDEIREGDSVEFDLKEGRKGLNAVDVRVL